MGANNSSQKSDLDHPPSDLDYAAGIGEELRILDLREVEERNDVVEEEEEEGGKVEDKEESESDDKTRSETAVNNKSGNHVRKKYCTSYMKTGTCKFGSNCMFNHPIHRKNKVAKEKVNEREELIQRSGPGLSQPQSRSQSQKECKYYLRTGRCKLGKACRYNHMRSNTTDASILELNFLDLPIRPGEKDCPHFMRHGSCKFAANCRFNHPDPTTVGGSDCPSGKGNVVSVSSQAASEANLGSWSSPSTLNEPASPSGNSNVVSVSSQAASEANLGSWSSPSTLNEPASPSGNSNVVSVSSQAASEANLGSWSSPSALNEPASPRNGNVVYFSSQAASEANLGSWSSPSALNDSDSFVPTIYSPIRGVHSQSSEWNGDQPHLYPPNRSVHSSPTYVMNNPVEDTNDYTNHQPQMPVDEFPEQAGQPDCNYFLKTGDHKHKSNCKFHLPKNRRLRSLPCTLNNKGLPLRPDQNICPQYSRHGICKFGRACKFDHSVHLIASSVEDLLDPPQSFGNSASREETGIAGTEHENGSGNKIQQGEEYPHYMRNGSCKCAANCRFSHPDPTTVDGSDSPSENGNVVSVSSQAASEANLGSWSYPSALNEPGSSAPMIYSPTQGVHSQSSEWNGDQPHLFPADRSVHSSPTYVMNNPVIDTNDYANHQPQMTVDEFSEQAGQPDCNYFLKTGDRKHKSNCKFHHPKNRKSRSLPCTLSNKGLPLRPDKNICPQYSRHGICKFGPACKFDHPLHLAASSVEEDVLDPPQSFGNSASRQKTGIAGTGTGPGPGYGSGNKIQKAV